MSTRPNAFAPARIDPQTHDHVARQFVAEHGHKIRYIHDARCWLICDEAYGNWYFDRTKATFNAIADLCLAIARSVNDVKTQHVMGSVHFVRGVEEFAKSKPEIAITQDKCDRDPMLLGTPIGTVDLRTGVWRRGDPSDLITRCTRAIPQNLPYPKWLQFLEHATGGDHEMIGFLQRFAGYCLTGETSEHAIVFIHGDGGTGKGTFLRALDHVLGDYAGFAQMATFCTSPNERHSNVIARLRPFRFVWSSENDRSRRWNEALLKQISGGDPVAANLMHRDTEQWTPRFKVAMAGNHQPKLEDVDNSIRRRFYLVPFDRIPERPDTGLEQRLHAERDGILWWALQGCLEWQRRGLAPPPRIKQATAKYLDAQDVMSRFFAERCQFAPERKVRMKELQQAAEHFAAAEGLRRVRPNEVAEALSNRDITVERGTGNVNFAFGICLRAVEVRD